jgi:hypothetical protein
MYLAKRIVSSDDLLAIASDSALVISDPEVLNAKLARFLLGSINRLSAIKCLSKILEKEAESLGSEISSLIICLSRSSYFIGFELEWQD